MSDSPLWDSAEVAARVKRSKRYLVERLRHTDGFPKPLKYPSRSGRSRLTWYAEQIEAWLAAQQAQ